MGVHCRLYRASAYSFSESGQLLRLNPAEDVESIGKGGDEEDVRDDEGGHDVLVTFYLVAGLVVGDVPLTSSTSGDDIHLDMNRQADRQMERQTKKKCCAKKSA